MTRYTFPGCCAAASLRDRQAEGSLELRRLLDGQVGWLCLFPLSLEHGVTHPEQESDPDDLRHHHDGAAGSVHT